MLRIELEALRDKLREESATTEKGMSDPRLTENQKFFLGGLSAAYSEAAEGIQDRLDADEARTLFEARLIG